MIFFFLSRNVEPVGFTVPQFVAVEKGIRDLYG